MTINSVKQELAKYSSEQKAKFLLRFFKSGPGEYAEGDKFIGVTVPNCRLVSKKFNNLSLPNIKVLMASKIHEERLVALLILVDQFSKAGSDLFKNKLIFKFYISNIGNINNWDLVDLSAPKIIGEWFIKSNDLNPKLLKQFAKSNNLWKRRIAIISTFAFIKRGVFNPTIEICKILLDDKHDLIHKATGWMLREVGKKNLKILEAFVTKNYLNIPRTTLRYAIERFPEDKRLKYLNLMNK